MPIGSVKRSEHPIKGLKIEKMDVFILIDILIIIPVNEVIIKSRDINQHGNYKDYNCPYAN